MTSGPSGETAEEKRTRREREAALDRGEVVTYLGMTMQRRPDGFYLDGEKVEEPLTLKECRAQLEARRVPRRARDTDHQRRGKTGEHRGLPIPGPISTGAGARTVEGD